MGNKNPLKGMYDFYKDQVKENDKKGYSDKFKECTEVFISSLLKKDKIFPVFHVEDLEYLDGYFIFGYGSNSVVHFHIKECPEWKFGIWWDIPEPIKDGKKKIIPNYINGRFFGQYEAEIDKFKPTASTIVDNFSVSLGDDLGPDLFFLKRQINFIHKEPELAFCRDYRGWDYNEEYHTREEAKEEYKKYKKWKKNQIKYTKVCDDKLLAYFKEKVLPLYKDAEIIDNGDCTSPRYELIAPYESNKDLFEKPGFFSCFEENSKEQKSYNKIKKECEAISDKYNFWWWQSISDTITVYKKEC